MPPPPIVFRLDGFGNVLPSGDVSLLCVASESTGESLPFILATLLLLRLAVPHNRRILSFSALPADFGEKVNHFSRP